MILHAVCCLCLNACRSTRLGEDTAGRSAELLPLLQPVHGQYRGECAQSRQPAPAASTDDAG